MSGEVKCAACGCSCNSQPMDDTAPTEPAQEEKKPDDGDYHEETKLAVLIALVPAMTMTIFNLMGLI